MKVLAVIPARWKSTRFEGKPIVPIAGVPMIVRVWNQVQKANRIDEIVLATDDDRIAATCREHGLDWIMTSDQCPTGTDRVAEVATQVNADVYVNVQGDEPLISPADIDRLVEAHQRFAEEGVDVTNAYVDEGNLPYRDDALKAFLTKTTRDRVLYFSRCRVPYGYDHAIHRFAHLGLYSFTREALQRYVAREQGFLEKMENVEMLRFLEYGDEIGVTEVQSGSKTVDYPEDVAEVETILAGGYQP